MMRKHIPIALSLAVLFGVMTIGCGKAGSTTGDGESVNTSVNTSNDFFNCGQYSNACAGDKICQNGICTEPKVGDVISFGHYQIYGSQTKTPIQWYILDIDRANHRFKLLSVDILEGNWEYHKLLVGDHVTWAESTTRSWLNGYGPSENERAKDYTSSNFISSAFTSEERARIPSVQLVNANNPESGTPGGMNTTDKVFLLSIDEVRSLLESTNEHICVKIHCTYSWWLRSPGIVIGSAAFVSYDGDGIFSNVVYYDYIIADGASTPMGLRPALWLNYSAPEAAPAPKPTPAPEAAPAPTPNAAPDKPSSAPLPSLQDEEEIIDEFDEQEDSASTAQMYGIEYIREITYKGKSTPSWIILKDPKGRYCAIVTSSKYPILESEHYCIPFSGDDKDLKDSFAGNSVAEIDFPDHKKCKKVNTISDNDYCNKFYKAFGDMAKREQFFSVTEICKNDPHVDSEFQDHICEYLNLEDDLD